MIFAPSVRVAKRQPIINRNAVVPKPMLRSLPMAKLCTHLGDRLTKEEVKANQLSGCRTCTNEVPAFHCKLPGAKKFNDGPYTRIIECMNCDEWEQKPHELPAIPVANSWKTIRFDSSNFFPDLRIHPCNSSILETRDGYLYAFRSSWGNANVSIVRLSRDFVPVGEPVRLKLHRTGLTTLGREDPRLFWHKGKPHVWYMGWNGDHDTHATNVLYARICEQSLKVEDIFFPEIPDRKHWEKNHAYFDYQGQLHCVYSIVPHRVHRVYCNTVDKIYETPTVVQWRFGYLRGGASPVLHRGEYYHFFHGMIEIQGHRLYSMGCAVFEARPPFKITRITHEPLDVASRNVYGGPDVIFPGGAVVVGDQWAIAMGVHDKWSEIRFYDLDWVESNLSPTG